MHEGREILRSRTQYHPAEVFRDGSVVVKDSGPWSSSVHGLLRHLEAEGFTASPRVAGEGFDASGRQTLEYIEGEALTDPMWSEDACHRLGVLLRRLHELTSGYAPTDPPTWYPWFGRRLGDGQPVIGHCDLGPWNVIARDRTPVAFIDWDFAGPVDPTVELAQTCWLNAKLHNDVVAGRESLPPLSERTGRLRALVDGYRLPVRERRVLVERMIEVAVHASANEADEAGIRGTDGLEGIDRGWLWALAWRARDASWLMEHRGALEAALA